MELIFLGTGQTTPVKQNARTRSSLAVKTRNLTFMIDCTPDFLKQAEKARLDKIDFILFTHGHSDSIGGIPDLRIWLNKKDISKITVFMHRETYKIVKQKFKSISHLDIKYFQSDVPITISGKVGDEGLNVTPFEVTHSIHPGFPAVGFKFLDIVYSGDVGGIPEKSMKYYKNANIVIFDAAMWFGRQIKGNYNTAKALQFAKQIKPKQFVLIQAGHTYPHQKEAEAKIQQYWKEIHGDDNTQISLAYDNMRLILREHISQILYEVREGMYLAQPQGSLIYSGEKTLIVKSKLFKHKVGAFLYLIEDNLCYGIIQLKHPDKINLTEFKKLEDKHRITEEERQKWWPYKEILYAYEFEIITLFDEPKRVAFSKIQTFIKDFKFLEEEKLIKDPKNYDPEKLPTDVLRDDWRIVNAWYASKKEGRKVKHSLEDIINLAKMVYLELKKRGTIFHPETMKPYPKELYGLVSNKSIENSMDLDDPKLLEELEDKLIIKDFISVVGSYAEEKTKPHDVDFLIRLSNPPASLKRAIETRILKDLSFSNKVHFIWGDPEGPHDTFVPLYDLQLRRIKPLKIVRMQEEIIELDTVMPFYPMRTRKRFYQADEVVSYMFKTGNKYALEKKFKGYRAILMKTGDRIRIYSDQKKDISKHFHTILSEAKELTNKDLVIDTELIYKGGGRAEIAKFITGKEELDDSNIQLHVFDCIYYKKDLTKLPWYERNSILHSLNFTNHIQEVSSIIVNNQEAAQKGIKFLRNLKGSEGTMVKRYDGKYVKNKETNAWIKFRNEDDSKLKLEATPSATTTATPGISDVQGKKIVKVRIPGPKKKKELEEIEQELQDKEGGEQLVKDFPERMQRNFKRIKESGKWKSFVIQWHLRGEQSIHSDLRLDIGELLEGFTLFTPSSTDKPDLLTKNPHDIRGTIKIPQPREWLTVQGGYRAGAPGTTAKHNAYLAIVAKGKYRPIDIEDHKITFELKSTPGNVKKVKSISKDDDKFIEAFNSKLPDNLKDLNGCFSYHIANIKGKYIILFDKLKECPKGGD